MRSLTPSLALLPLFLPAAAYAAAQEVQTLWYPNAAEDCGTLADKVIGAGRHVDTVLHELGVPTPASAAGEPDRSLPEVVEGQSAAVSDGGLFFDAANSQLVYLDNVRLNDARVQLRAAHRLYIQLPKEQDGKEEEPGGKAATAPTPAAANATAEPPTEPAPQQPDASVPAAGKQHAPLDITAYDAVVDTVANRMLFTTGPQVPQLIIRQGGNELILGQGEGKPARALADEAGNLLLEAATIYLQQEEADGRKSTFSAGGGRAFYHAASHTLVMEGPVNIRYRDGESALDCTGRFAVTLQEEEGATAPADKGFMSQFTALRFSGIAAASATGNVQLRSHSGTEEVALAGDALHYNGLTGEVEVPGTPCLLSYGEGGKNTLQTNGSIVLEQNGDIRMSGGVITGVYERPAREKGATPQKGTLTATAPITFHANSGTVSAHALSTQDAESSFSCTGAVQLALTPRPEEELAKLPSREKTGMLNLAIARYSGISTAKAAGEVRAQLLDPATPDAPEATFTGSQLLADLVTGEVQLYGINETAGISFRGYSLSGTPANGSGEATVHLLPNGDIDARAAHVHATLPSDKGMTTIDSSHVAHLARESRLLNLGANTRIHSPEGIITTRGPLVAVLAPATTERKPASPRYPQLCYNFSGLESAETGEGATVRAPQGSLQCSGQLSIVMGQAGKGGDSALNGIRSALAIGQVALAAKDDQGRIIRAAGDRLDVNGTTGEKRLTGRRVVLEDANNRHEASGAGAAITLDKRNNARITGERHSTAATGIRKQSEQQKGQTQSETKN